MNEYSKKKLFNNSGSTNSGSSTVTPNVTDYATISTTVGNNTAEEGFYLIEDSSAADLGVLIQVFKDANGELKVRVEAEGVYSVPDYQMVGDYSGVAVVTGIGPGFQRGVWYAGAESGWSTGDIVIWNGYHYQILNSALLAGTDPGSAVLGIFQQLPRTAANVGYIVEADFIRYDFTNDTAVYRVDKRNNEVYFNLNSFQWGNDTVFKNEVKGDFSNLNSLSTATYGNTIKEGTSINCAGTFASIVGNTIMCTPSPTVPFITLDNTFSDLNYCDINTRESILFTGAQTLVGKTLAIDSNFEYLYDITGLTTLDIGANNNYIGIALIQSTNPTESINLFANFPERQRVRFYPDIVVLTFISGSGANQPICEGGINAVLDGSKGDWIEFTKINGKIYQTNIGTY